MTDEKMLKNTGCGDCCYFTGKAKDGKMLFEHSNLCNCKCHGGTRE